MGAFFIVTTLTTAKPFCFINQAKIVHSYSLPV